MARWCEERRTWCVRGAAGTARTAARPGTTTSSSAWCPTPTPDPRRAAAVRDALALLLSTGQVDLRDAARAPVAGWCSSAAGPATRRW